MDDNYLIIGEMGRDRLGDLSQFDGHTPGPWWRNETGGIMAGRKLLFDVIDVEASEVDCASLFAVPDLIAALKESRKEVEELRESNEIFRDWNDELQRLLNDSIDGQKEAAELRGRIDRALERLRYNASQGSSVENFPIIQELEGKQ